MLLKNDLAVTLSPHTSTVALITLEFKFDSWFGKKKSLLIFSFEEAVITRLMHHFPIDH
jgi:hypothetical protein